MYLHKLEAQIQKAIRTIEIELSAMEQGQRTKHGESVAHLKSERDCLKRLLAEIERHTLEEMKADHARASLLNREGQ